MCVCLPDCYTWVTRYDPPAYQNKKKRASAKSHTGSLK